MADTARPAHAGVYLPPPLWYAVGLAVGLAIGRWRPLPMTAAGSPARTAAAVAGAVAFAALALGAVATFRRARTTVVPNRPAAALVTGGPYRLTRNPMYLGLAALYVAVAALANSWWPVVLLPLVVAVIDRRVIAREERYLAGAFPDEYAAYCARVRRWL